MNRRPSRVLKTHRSRHGTSAPPMVALSSALFAVALAPPLAVADIHDLTVTDVTPHAFSVVWMSDDPVAAAGIHVYTDSAGGPEHDITADLDITLVSESYPPAHAQGIVKLDVVGLEPNTSYYFDVDMSTATEPVVDYVYPALDQPLLTAATVEAVQVTGTREGDADPDGPIANDLLQFDLYQPDGTTPAAGTLLLITAPDLAAHPLTAFVGEHADAPTAIVDANNFFNADGESLKLLPMDKIQLTEFRGLLCDASSHTLVHMRRVADEPDPTITELVPPSACFSPNGIPADFNCDGRISGGDFNLFLAQLGKSNLDESEAPCGFNSDYDFTGDGIVSGGDWNLLLSVLGSAE